MSGLTVETLSIERLKSAAGQRIFDKGLAYYQWGRVTVEEVDEQDALCYVQGTYRYPVKIRVANNYLYLKCECPFAASGAVCKHEVAACLAVGEYLRFHQPNQWKTRLSQVLQESRSSTPVRQPKPYLLFFSLQQSAAPAYNTWKIYPYQLPLSALPKELRSREHVWDTSSLHQSLEETPGLAMHIRNPTTALNPAGCVNCPVDGVILANVLIERARAFSYFYMTFPLGDYLTLVHNTQSPLFLGNIHTPVKRGLLILPQTGELQLSMSRETQGLLLKASLTMDEQAFELKAGDVQLVHSSPFWVLAGRYLFKMENEGEASFLTNWLETPELVVPPKDEPEFLEKYLLPLARQIPLRGELITWEEEQADPVPRLYLSDAQSGLHAQLRFGYGAYELGYESSLPAESLLRKPDSWTLTRILRQPEAEEAAHRSLSSPTFGLKKAPYAPQQGTLQLRARLHPIDFLLNYVPRLTQAGFEIYGEEQLKTARVNRSKPSLSFSISSGIDWFDVNAMVTFGENEVSWKEMRRLLRKKSRYVKLADGTIGEIPEEWIERYKHLFALGEDTGDGLRLSQHHLTLIDELLAGADRARTDPEFERRRQRLRELCDKDFLGISPRELPPGFQGELRPYQKSGYDWLHFLNELGFGGCLADDMGLGKTVQILVFLQSLYQGVEHGLPASLVVVPRSLLVNWQREAERFTPQLRLLEYFDQNRTRELEDFNQYDLVITTYGVMLRDIARLRSYTFQHVLLDESQAIKNPLSQTAKAARLLQAQRRLVLTGTPVENSSIELWSQFAFLNPGLLGNMEYFKTEFSTPIEKKGDEQAAQFLRRMVYPFILRRTKDQVAPELPPRSERILYGDMEPAQRKLYNRTRDYYRHVLLGMIENEGLNSSRMKILEGLLRLRQICNHPRLVDEKFRGISGKFELLLETLETLRAEGHKALVFSQFVQMLSLVREALDMRQIPYMYLDGQTQNRQERVDTFQADTGLPFFLISLKAGGVGLNLTAADYVIHIDPWWNPAVEMQASDRTHRIGQHKPVFVYKLITRESVEEKILQLQERKKKLVEQLITTESSFFKELNAEDVRVLFS